MEWQSLGSSKSNAYTLLQQCIRRKDLKCGRHVQKIMTQDGIDSFGYLDDHLIRLFTNCDCLIEASQAFIRILDPSVYSWSAIFAAYANLRQPKTGLEMYKQMQLSGAKRDKYVYIAVIKACTLTCSLFHGRMVHEQIIISGFYSDVFVGSTLIDMYAKCGCLDNAYDVFVKLSKANVVSWSALITGYAVHGEGFLALQSFDSMKLDGIRPDKVIFLGILKACGSIGSLEQSRQVHEEIINCHLHLDVSLQNTLVDVYAKCGCLEEACRNFDKLSNRDAVSWGAMISGYVQHDQCAIALDYFEYMQQEGIKPDRITFLAILKACGNIGAVEAGKQMHEQIVANSLQSDPFIGSTLVDMYAKCGSLEDAGKVFNQLTNRDAVSWGTMITGYSQHDESFIALDCFDNMQQEEIEPDNITYPSILQACGSIGAMCQGRYIHTKILEDCLHYDPFIGSALVDMYANCGSLQESRSSFSDLTIRNVVSWNAMLSGYAQIGDPTSASRCFDEMQSVGIQPDEMSFCGVLNACSHAGLVDEGREYFKCMRECHGIVPNLFHYNCMVDLLGSSGYFKEAEDLLYAAVKPNMCGLMALLYACSMHANVEVGKRCFDEIVCLDPGFTQAYVLMSNIYAYVGCY